MKVGQFVYFWQGSAGVAIAVVEGLLTPSPGYSVTSFTKMGPGDTEWVRLIERLITTSQEIIIESGGDAVVFLGVVRRLGGHQARLRKDFPLTAAAAVMAIAENPIPVTASQAWADLTGAARRNKEVDLCEMAVAMACHALRGDSNPSCLRRDGPSHLSLNMEGFVSALGDWRGY